MTGAGKTSFTWSELLVQWRCIVTDFQAVYHVDLREVFNHKPWAWFEPLASALMQRPESCLHQALMPPRK